MGEWIGDIASLVATLIGAGLAILVFAFAIYGVIDVVFLGDEGNTGGPHQGVRR